MSLGRFARLVEGVDGGWSGFGGDEEPKPTVVNIGRGGGEAGRAIPGEVARGRGGGGAGVGGGGKSGKLVPSSGIIQRKFKKNAKKVQKQFKKNAKKM